MTEPQIDPHLITLSDNGSLISEQYRNIRNKILLATEVDSKKSILLTSAVPGEGKTLTSINLAITIAKGIHEQVLLVDTDLRHPSIHTLLGMKPEKGLTDYLTEDISSESILLSTVVDRLTFIPGGNPVPNSSELLASEKMSTLVKELKNRYPDKIIIFDSAPVIPTVDPIILDKMVDWTIFIILAGKTPRQTVARALSSYKPKNFLGIILNQLETLPEEYLYGSNHYYTPDK